MVEGSGFENRRSRKATRGSNPLSSAKLQREGEVALLDQGRVPDAFEWKRQGDAVKFFVGAAGFETAALCESAGETEEVERGQATQIPPTSDAKCPNPGGVSQSASQPRGPRTELINSLIEALREALAVDDIATARVAYEALGKLIGPDLERAGLPLADLTAVRLLRGNSKD